MYVEIRSKGKISRMKKETQKYTINKSILSSDFGSYFSVILSETEVCPIGHRQT